MRLVVALALTQALIAQDPGFQVESKLVSVPVLVTDRAGRAVSGISPSQFLLLDNGKPQPVIVDTFDTGTAPIALVIAVQSSGISVPVLQKVQKIGAMVQPLITGERGCAGLLTFDQSVRWRQECTADVDKLSNAFDKLTAGEGKTAHLLDAADLAIQALARKPNVRRVLFLISESKDRGSDIQLDEVVLKAQAAGVAVYCATYSAFRTAFTTRASPQDPPPETPIPRTNRTEPLSPKGRVPIPPAEQRVDFLGGIEELVRLGKIKASEVLTTSTGGTTFPFTRQKALEEAVANLGAELHTQYVLSFTPVHPGPGRHTLQVTVAGSPELRVRARPAYWVGNSP